MIALNRKAQSTDRRAEAGEQCLPVQGTVDHPKEEGPGYPVVLALRQVGRPPFLGQLIAGLLDYEMAQARLRDTPPPVCINFMHQVLVL